METLGLVVADADDDDAGTELRNAVVARIEKFDVNSVAECGNGVENVLAIVVELGVEEAPDILQHYGSGTDFPDKPDCFGEEVSLVGFAELLGGDGERRTGDPAREQVNATVGPPVELVDIAANDIPRGPVGRKNIAVFAFVFDESDVFKTCPLKTDGLSAGTGANFNASQLPVVLGPFKQSPCGGDMVKCLGPLEDTGEVQLQRCLADTEPFGRGADDDGWKMLVDRRPLGLVGGFQRFADLCGHLWRTSRKVPGTNNDGRVLQRRPILFDNLEEEILRTVRFAFPAG